jgi:uncharacterized protein (TIGR02058 family)
MVATAKVWEFGMGVDVHGNDGTKAALRAVSDAIRHSSLGFLPEIRDAGGKMLVRVTVGVPDPSTVDAEAVRASLPHGEVSVEVVPGGLKAAGCDAMLACVIVTVLADYPD